MWQCTVQKVLQAEVAELKKELEKSENYIGSVPISTHLNIRVHKKMKKKKYLATT